MSGGRGTSRTNSIDGDQQVKGLKHSPAIDSESASHWAVGLPPPTPLVGRDSERAALLRIVLGPARLVTLTGSGGTGKTRLAQAVVGDVRAGFRDGVWPVEL